jgi:hypothetical protein
MQKLDPGAEKRQKLQAEVDKVKEIMLDNTKKIAERGDRLNHLEERAST